MDEENQFSFKSTNSLTCAEIPMGFKFTLTTSKWSQQQQQLTSVQL